MGLGCRSAREACGWLEGSAAPRNGAASSVSSGTRVRADSLAIPCPTPGLSQTLLLQVSEERARASPAIIGRIVSRPVLGGQAHEDEWEAA